MGFESKADFAAKYGEEVLSNSAQRCNSSQPNFKFNSSRRETEDTAISCKQSSWQEEPSTSCFDKRQDPFSKRSFKGQMKEKYDTQINDYRLQNRSTTVL